MSYHPRATRLSVLALVVAVSLVGCDTTRPTASATPAPISSQPDATRVFAEIRQEVELARGLQATGAVDPVTIDPEQLAANLEAEFDAEYPADELADTEDMLIALGLLPPGSSIRQLTLDLQEGQVAGYYSPDKDQLFVVRRSGDDLGAIERVTYAHEFNHQLQDQHFQLDRFFEDAADETDGALGRLALIEGDAVSIQATWMTQNLTPRELGELIAVALGPGSLESLQRAPRYLRETALFPYEDGFAFTNRLLAGGGYPAVDAAYADPPQSTEQVLHPDRYLQRETPDEVRIPTGLAATLGAGWSEAGQDTLGELVLRIWLREGEVTLPDARVAAAGWGGDRLILLRGGDDAVAVGLVTAWDTPADALEFASSAEAAVSVLDPDGVVVHEPGSAIVIVTLGAEADALADALETAEVAEVAA
jgi:hypothetical protein